MLDNDFDDMGEQSSLTQNKKALTGVLYPTCLYETGLILISMKRCLQI